MSRRFEKSQTKRRSTMKTKAFILFMPGRVKITLFREKGWLVVLGFFLLSVGVFPVAASAKTYQVKAGDTLYSLSKQFGTTVEVLQEINGLKGTVIRVGQDLVIPKQGEQPKETKSTQVTYTVQANDCLYLIGRRYGVKAEDIMAANGLTSTNIHPGQVLIIPRLFKTGGKTELKPTQLPSRGLTLKAIGEVLDKARALIGSKYAYGGSGPNAFDCSGFTAYVFRCIGLDLPHNAKAQAGQGIPVEQKALQPGDLVFFSYYQSGDIQHVGIYSGEGNFIHASSSGGVKYSSLNDSYYLQNYRGARRLVR